MVTLPLGYQAYKRKFAGEPEIRLVNRFLEKNPTNLREGTGLLSRAGSAPLTKFDDGAGAVAPARGTFSKTGLFNGDLFGVSGGNLYRYSSDGTLTHITGLVNAGGLVTYAWMKGIGYEYLFIADGLLLQFYQGGTHATGTLTKTGAITTAQKINIGGTYYGWNDAVDTNAPDGTLAHPWLAKLSGDPMLNMAHLLNFDGVRGVDFSTALGGPSPIVSGSNPGVGPFTTMVVTAKSGNADGNLIATLVTTGPNISFGAATLSGGGTHVLQGVEMPDGNAAKCLASLNGFVLVGVGRSQLFYWIEPGAVIIDPLNFASKESNPDNIVDMVTIGDQTIIAGAGSTENWYATGNFAAPFAPMEGRVYRRGFIEGSIVAVKDSMIGIGDDLVVYSIGYGYGDTSQYGVHPISTHGIDERIRVQIRSENGEPP